MTISRRKALLIPFVPLMARLGTLAPRYTVWVSTGRQVHRFVCSGARGVERVLARFGDGMATVGRGGRMYGIDLRARPKVLGLP